MSRKSAPRSLRWIKSIFPAAKSRKKSQGRRLGARLHVQCLEDRLALTTVVLGQQPGAPNNIVFHGDEAGTGFNQNETVLTPANVASSFGQVWNWPAARRRSTCSRRCQRSPTRRSSTSMRRKT